MPLTAAQLTTLKVDMDANHATEVANGDAGVLLAIYNAQASPDFFVWKTFVDNMLVKEEGIDWTEFIGRSGGERAAFDLLTRGDGFNASKPNVRQGFVDIFSGPSGATTRGLLLDIAAREATVSEKLFADTSGGNGSTKGQSATMVVEGNLSLQDMRDALALP